MSVKAQNTQISFKACPEDNHLDCSDIQILSPLTQSKVPIFLSYSVQMNKFYALKFFPFVNQRPSSLFKNETQFSFLSHPNILAPIFTKKAHACKVQEGRTVKGSIVVTEFSPYGNFHELTQKPEFQRNTSLIRTYFDQLISAVQYLHKNQVAHLDIKPQNLMIGQDLNLKIIDFDYSMLNTEDSIDFFHGEGSEHFRAPELASGTVQDLYACDVFSMGVTLFYLMAGYLPFGESFDEGLNEDSPVRLQEAWKEFKRTDKRKFWSIHEKNLGKNSEVLSKDFRELFEALCNVDAEKRPTADQIRGYKWLGDTKKYSMDELKGVLSPLTRSEELEILQN